MLGLCVPIDVQLIPLISHVAASAPTTDAVIEGCIVRERDGTTTRVEVEVRCDSLAEAISFLTDVDGRFRLEGLPPGHYRLSLCRPELRRYEFELGSRDEVEIQSAI